jgi:hypothetical protein
MKPYGPCRKASSCSSSALGERRDRLLLARHPGASRSHRFWRIAAGRSSSRWGYCSRRFASCRCRLPPPPPFGPQHLTVIL